jgi:alginate O-acetyltransferase complex protein AlgI
VITSPIYWALLAATAVVSWLVPRAWRMPVLAAASAGAIISLSPVHGVAFVALTVAYHHLAFLAAARGGRGWIWLVVAALVYLAFFKYAPGLFRAVLGDGSRIAAIAVPVGISYFTFKVIHFLIEVHRGTIKDRSLSSFMAYMLLFPIFTAGPIERFDHFLARRADRCSLDDICTGGTRIAHGLIKRFVIADILLAPLIAPLGTAEVLTENLHILPWYKVTAFLVGNYLLVYLDFSAYSDIAIGSSRILGFRIVENFNWPILARSIQEFWKRWHMSLVNWCQSYIFMPLIGKYRNPYLAVFVTFLVIGVWHEASLNWIAWALHHATGLAVHMRWSRFKRTLKHKPPDRGILGWWGWPLTFGYVSVSQAYLSTNSLGLYEGIRIVAKLLFLELPA